MSVVACKIYKDKIEMASDSIAVKGWATKINKAENKIVKMMKYNNMIIGGCGDCDEISLLFHYMKTHTIEKMDEKSVLDFIIEFVVLYIPSIISHFLFSLGRKLIISTLNRT